MTQLSRLREGRNIVGYEKTAVMGARVFSKDGYWWTTETIAAGTRDRYAGLEDQNRQPVFEHDIIRWRRDPRRKDYIQAAIIWSTHDERLVVFHLETGVRQPLYVGDVCLLGRDDICVVSHTFLNPSIEEELGL